jgi:hypothetical protein
MWDIILMMKNAKKFFLGLLSVLLAGGIGALLGHGLLQLIFFACLIVALVFLVVYFWKRDRALAVGLLVGALSPVWGLPIVLLLLWWAPNLPL